MSVPPLNDEAWSSQVIAKMSRQEKLYAQLLNMASQQRGFLENGSTEDLLRLLANRERMLDEIRLIQGELAPLKEDWDARIERMNPVVRDQLAQMKMNIQSTLDQIMALDEQDKQLMQDQRDQISSKLKQVKQGGAAHQAYGQFAAKAYQQNVGRRRMPEQEG